MLLTIALPLISLLSLATAQTACDNSNAMSYEQFIASFSQGSTTSQSSDGSDTSYRRSLLPRAIKMECNDNESCIAAWGIYGCVDRTTLAFRDSNGGHGNFKSTQYTMSNGQVTQVALDATAMPTPTATASDSSATATGSGPKATGAASSSATTFKANIFLGMGVVAMGAVGVLL